MKTLQATKLKRAASTKRTAGSLKRLVVPLYNQYQLEMWEGRPHYLHTADCPNYCDYACNGQRGFDVADRIAAERDRKSKRERHNEALCESAREKGKP